MHDVFYQPRLLFIIGDFKDREALRVDLHYPTNRDKYVDDLRTPRYDWIDATFAADHTPLEPNYRKRVDPEGRPFGLFRLRDRILLMTHEIQTGIRYAEPVSDSYGELPVSKFGGIVPYNHHLVNHVRKEGEITDRPATQHPKVLSIVVAQQVPKDLEGAIQTEFHDGVDIFLNGEREAQEYLRLIQAWFGSTVNPNNHRRARFNPNRFKQSANGLLVPQEHY